MKDQYHFIGIGGIGMSGIARIMLSRNIQVSGSDIAANAIIDGLKQAGAQISIGHSAQNIAPGMTVVYTTDIRKDNPEYQAALTQKCPMLHRSQLLQKLMENSHSLAVAGTHGKTTTSSLLTWVLLHADLNPSYAIGGIVPQLKSNAGHGQGDYFVAEACESDGTFLNYTPYGAIITNIDNDHMDFYKTEETLVRAFQDFMGKVISPEHLFWCGDDHTLLRIANRGISYGFDSKCQLRVEHFTQRGWYTSFDIHYKGKVYRNIEVALAGRHNALNASAVFGLALTLGVDEEKIREALRTFGGVMRRCEKKGEGYGIEFYDDYAHHPTEIRATLKAIRGAIGERRLVVAYQPHRYSRAKELIGNYSNVFEEADELFVSEIYAAGEQPIPGVSHETLFEEIKRDLNDRCHHVERAQLAPSLSKFLRPHDVCISLGAGDITKLSGEILTLLKLNHPKKLSVGVIMGGRSVEHEISLLSSEHVIASLRSDYYDVTLFGIDRGGHWLCGPQTKHKLQQEGTEGHPLKVSPEILAELQGCDIVFPVLHGPYGEDGTIQGFFEILGLAYVGCDHRSAAVSMDKALTKILLLDANIATSPFITFSHCTWQSEKKALLSTVHQKLKYPVFVKPVHLGSSVGVHKVECEDMLEKAVDDAFRFDTHLLIENGIKGREIEFSVLGNDHVIAFPPGEILTEGRVYDYEGKYSKNGIKAIPHADLSPQLIEEGIDFVIKAYKAARCTGMAWIDTFLDDHGKYWLNEINPIPGFTKISLFPQMCAVNGLKDTDLIDRLIILGLQRKRTIDRLELNP